MIRKRIEIVCCVALAGGILSGAPAAARTLADGKPAGALANAWSFPVYTEDASIAVELPALPSSPLESESPDLFVPDIPYSFFWGSQDGLLVRAAAHARDQEVSEHSPGLLGGFDQPRPATPQTRWLAAPAQDGWTFGERSWQTRLDAGPRVLLGSSEVGVPEWNESVRLGGISLSQSFLASSDDVSQWNYSVAFGAVDHSRSGPGDLVFGPTAGSLAVNYVYSPQFSVESQTEAGTDFVMSGVTGQYDLGRLGRWRSGVARSTFGVKQGWRYRAMADFDLTRDIRFGWVGERYTDGFMDIRRYASGGASGAGGRQRWSAFWDTDQWGRWAGSFESVQGRQGAGERRFGVNQQFWYSPNLRIGVHAEREIIAGDYDIGLRFSIPLY